MNEVDSLIIGSEKLTKIFGHWPSFHDAEVHDLHLSRGNVKPDKGIYIFPVLTLKIHLWQLTREVDKAGFLICEHHTFATLRFSDVSDLEIEGLNRQNVLFGLKVTSRERSNGPSPYLAVELDPSFGIGASFNCLRMEVVDAMPCTEKGDAIPENIPSGAE